MTILGEGTTVSDFAADRRAALAVLDLDDVIAACEARMTTSDDIGFCLNCGAENYGCEPDMRGGMCEDCGAPRVYGCEECLLMVA